MTEPTNLQYIHDAMGNAVSVIVPIDIWREIESERETAHLLKSPAMKARLLEAMSRGSTHRDILSVFNASQTLSEAERTER